MSDNQRRVTCRLAFLLICALPTAVSGYWICHPQTADRWQQILKAELGLETEIDFIATPNPFETVLHGVSFSDPEYGRLLETAAIEIRLGDQIHITVPHQVNRVNNRGLARMIKTIHQNSIRRGIGQECRILFEESIRIDRAEIAELYSGQFATGPNAVLNDLRLGQRESCLVSELQIDLEPSFEGTLVATRFRIPETNDLLAQPESDPVEIQLKKEKYGQAIWVNTSQQPLPCWLAAEFTEEITDGLGSTANFAGQFTLQTFADRNSELLINGDFYNVSASQYQFDLPNMTVSLDHCRLVNGQFDNWQATLSIPMGDQYRQLPIAPPNLYSNARRLVVGNAIHNTITQDQSPRVANEPTLLPRQPATIHR